MSHRESGPGLPMSCSLPKMVEPYYCTAGEEFMPIVLIDHPPKGIPSLSQLHPHEFSLETDLEAYLNECQNQEYSSRFMFVSTTNKGYG